MRIQQHVAPSRSPWTKLFLKKEQKDDEKNEYSPTSPKEQATAVTEAAGMDNPTAEFFRI